MISEIFYSIQSEGRTAGMPTVFLISSDGPPVRQTWCGQQVGRFQPGVETALGGLLSNARKHWADYAVITGGEPLAVPEIECVTEGLRRFEHHVTIETSGSLYTEIPCDLMSVNIKLVSQANPPKLSKGARPPAAYDLAVVSQIVAAYDYQLKFELSDRAEMEEVRHIAQETKAEKTKVLLMPTATKGKEWNEQVRWILEAARFFGYRYAPRLLMPAAEKPAPKQAGE